MRSVAPSPLGAFLGIEPAVNDPDGALVLPITDRVLNSYGAPMGGAPAIIAAELAMADNPQADIESIHVRYLGRANDSLVARRNPAPAASQSRVVDVEVTDADGRLVAHATVTTRPPPADDCPVADGPETKPPLPPSARRWRHVPLLAALEIDELVANQAASPTFELPLGPNARTASGGVHAGAVFTLADLAGGQSALLAHQDDNVALVTLVASLHILGEPGHGPLRTVPRNLHHGRTTTTVSVKIVNTSLTTVASAIVTMLRLNL